MKPVIFKDEEYKEILQHLNHLMQEAEELPYPNAKELVFDILKYFDSIHREPLARMTEMISTSHPELRKKMAKDFPVNTLLGLYDLADLPAKGTQAGALEAEKQTDDPRVLSFIPEEQVGLLTPLVKKEWLELGLEKELEEGKVYPKNFEKLNFLIAKTGSEIYAMDNICMDSILPLDLGQLEEHYLICPWHGCRYDLKTGIAVNQTDKKLTTYPTEIASDGILKVEICL